MENRVVIEFRKVCWRSMASRSRNVILMKKNMLNKGRKEEKYEFALVFKSSMMKKVMMMMMKKGDDDDDDEKR